MKRILLTTTSLVLAAGVANADVSIAWSGAATVGVAREGGAQAGAAGTQNAVSAADEVLATAAVVAITDNATYDAFVLEAVVADIAAADAAAVVAGMTTATAAGATLDLARADIAAIRAQLVLDGSSMGAAAVTAATLAMDSAEAILDATNGAAATAAGAAGDFETYSEVNATVVGTASMDNGMSLSASVSVDAGKGYDFADDDGFDAAKTNGVALDNVTLSMGSLGTLVIDENAVAHLVDGDDDAAADLLYTNTVGAASVSLAMDISADTDLAARNASATIVTTDAGVAGTGEAGEVATVATAARAADVAWSASVSMPLAGGSVNAAMDEEGGNSFGASGSVAGITLGFTSALEALQEELNADRSNTVTASYAMGAVTMGASWNSVEDGDQWGISAAYAADGVSISASTDEGSDWAVTGSMDLGGGASVVGGVNYTEDAYVGMSFAF